MYRRFRRPNLWQEMERMQREMNRLAGESFGGRLRTAPGFPAMNIWAGPDGLVVMAEVPGVNSDDININVVGDVLTLSGSRQPDPVEEGCRYHRQERGFGSFSRTIQLPYRVEPENVDATFRKGVLTVSLPRAESDKPKKISVKAG